MKRNLIKTKTGFQNGKKNNYVNTLEITLSMRDKTIQT